MDVFIYIYFYIYLYTYIGRLRVIQENDAALASSSSSSNPQIKKEDISINDNLFLECDLDNNDLSNSLFNFSSDILDGDFPILDSNMLESPSARSIGMLIFFTYAILAFLNYKCLRTIDFVTLFVVIYLNIS
jgi:hypothetical protein